MTRNSNGNRIGGASARDGSSSFGMSDAGGDLAIRFRCATRNPLQLLPNAPLERGGLNVQRKRYDRFSLDYLAKRFHLRAELAFRANNLRFGILRVQLAL